MGDDVADAPCGEIIDLFLQLLHVEFVKPCQRHHFRHVPLSLEFRYGHGVPEIGGIVGHIDQTVRSGESDGAVQLEVISHGVGLKRKAFLPCVHGVIHSMVFGGFGRNAEILCEKVGDGIIPLETYFRLQALRILVDHQGKHFFQLQSGILPESRFQVMGPGKLIAIASLCVSKDSVHRPFRPLKGRETLKIGLICDFCESLSQMPVQIVHLAAVISPVHLFGKGIDAVLSSFLWRYAAGGIPDFIFLDHS